MQTSVPIHNISLNGPVIFPRLHWNIGKGNYYRSLTENNTDGVFQIHNSLFIEPVSSVYQPEPEQSYTIFRHIHPVVILKAGYFQGLKTACFLVSENRIILQAFSGLTGLDTGYLKKSTEKYTPFVVLDEGVIKM